jgi:hypothetical protein
VLDDGALLSPFSIGIDGSYDPPDKAPRIVR